MEASTLRGGVDVVLEIGQTVAARRVRHDFHRIVIPACVDDPYAAQVEPEGQCLEPLDVVLAPFGGQLLEEREMVRGVCRALVTA